MPSRSPHLWLALAVALLASCSSFSDTGSAQFAVSVPQALNATISRVYVTSSADDFPSVSVDLAPTNGVWGGIIGNIPTGSNRIFHAQAFNSAGNLLFEGSATGVTISANQITLIAITLQQVNLPPPFQNEAPIISSLVTSATSMPASTSISLVASVRDPNPGDTLTYAWTSTAGTFLAAAAASTSWTAPATTGIQELTFTVTDSGGLSSSVSLAVNVIQAGGQGDARLSIIFNSSPVVASISASPTRVAPGRQTAVSAIASDPDGDSLSYSWSATCAGAWLNATAQSAEFTPSSVPVGACNNCQLRVSVADGRGGQTTGTVALCVSNTPPANHFPPVIIRSYRSSDTATPGQVITYEVTAEDPESSALTFSWSASVGTLGTPATTATSSRITWTAPACMSGGVNPNVTATITNAFNLTATKNFPVAGLPLCSLWSATGSMAQTRTAHTATRLLSGKILVVGGYNGTYHAAVEIYDPTSGLWSPAGSISSPRSNHTATLLRDGRVLIVGGNGSSILAAAEMYDPVSNTWSPAGSMSSPRTNHTATLLRDGRVLVSGGTKDGSITGDLATAEIYDPASRAWSATASMGTARRSHTSTLLLDGRVLVSAGYGESTGHLATAEIYDPGPGTWTTTGSMAWRRSGHRETLLLNGKVLVVGGFNFNDFYFSTAEIYDPGSGTWAITGSMAQSRTTPTVTLLPNGNVLVVGGFNGIYHATAEIYDPTLGTWNSTASMGTPRQRNTATLLQNGKVLVAGGYNGSYHATAELYTP